jgi:uncharacterized cupredoxin-like copper-binding protein
MIETEQRRSANSPHEPCEECGSPLDAQQRYCVECGARRGNGANPASRYFATMSKRARRPAAGAAPKRPSSSRAAAVGFFALLPIAVALGLVVGRSGSGGSDEGALLKALKQSEAQTAAAAPTTTGTQTTTADKAKANANGKKGKGAVKKSKAEKNLEKEGGKVVAQTANGTVHQVTGYKAPQKKIEEDTKIVEENPEQTGENYIKAQQNLPDVVVVGGEGEGTPEASTPGVEP